MARRPSSTHAASELPKTLGSFLSTGEESAVHPECDHLRDLAAQVAKASNIVALVGAGISTKAGIEDYHSNGGRYANGNLFLRSFLRTVDGRKKFMEHAVALHNTALRSKPTKTHKVFLQLRDMGKLLRIYSQNVDGLEAAAGLDTNMAALLSSPPTCILLHGAIRTLRCELCCSTFEWRKYEQENIKLSLDAGTEFRCRHCQEKCDERTNRGKRKIAIGQLYPGIICSDDQHPQGAEIEVVIAKDERKADMLIILGTSLKFSGPRKLARRLATSVRKRKGKVIYVNKTEPSSGILQLVDYWVESTCDAWVEDLRGRISSGIKGKKH